MSFPAGTAVAVIPVNADPSPLKDVAITLPAPSEVNKPPSEDSEPLTVNTLSVSSQVKSSLPAVTPASLNWIALSPPTAARTTPVRAEPSPTKEAAVKFPAPSDEMFTSDAAVLRSPIWLAVRCVRDEPLPTNALELTVPSAEIVDISVV